MLLNPICSIRKKEKLKDLDYKNMEGHQGDLFKDLKNSRINPLNAT
jgi:hypothetical protein